jgi:hypothetical protein
MILRLLISIQLTHHDLAAFLSPESSVQCAVLDRLGDVAGFYGLSSGQVSDGTGDLQDAIVRSSAQSLFGYCALQEVFGFGPKIAYLRISREPICAFAYMRSLPRAKRSS